MTQIEEQISNLQTSLTETLIAIDYRFSILAEKQLAKRFKPLAFIYRLLDEYAILKVAVLIDIDDRFHIQKPYLKLLSDPVLNRTLTANQIEAIKAQNNELTTIVSSEFAKRLTKVRNKYIAHNDLLTRQSSVIDMKEINEFVVSIIKVLNTTCNELGLPTIPKASIKANSLDDMLQALKDCR
ncbi:AbiU2 domain-containing protein [Flaviaesturariibacter terrae]